MEKVKTRFTPKYIFKYLSLFFVCLVLANVDINGLSPFLYAFFFACLFVGLDEKLLSVFTLVSALVTDMSMVSLFSALTVVGVGLVVFYIHLLAKKRFHIITLFISLILGFVTIFYYHLSDLKFILSYAVLGLVCLWAFITVVQVLLLRKNCFKLTLDETICFLFFLAILGIGLEPIHIYEFSIARLVIMLAIFISIAVGSPSLTIILTLTFSLGMSIKMKTLDPVAEFALISMLSSVFAMPHRFKIVLMAILSELIVQVCFFSTGISLVYSMLPIVLAGLIFVILPNSCLTKISNVVYVKKSEIASRNLINTTRRSIRRRMSELSNVFMDMKEIHLNMVKRQLNKEEVEAMLTREIMNSCCKDCLDKHRCTRSLGKDNKSYLETLIDIAMNKGKVSLLDIPSGLLNRCGKVNNLITMINRLSDEYRQYKNIMADINNVKILLADQMGAVSRLLLTLGEEIDTNVTFDVARENKIISKLLSNNIDCKEVLLYTEKTDNMSAVLVVKANKGYEFIVEKVVSEVLKTSMKISNVRPVDDSSYCSVTLNKKSKFDCVFGLASCNKAGNNECGDCHSIIRLNGDRFLLALCDGMGSGKSAHQMSAMTLGLIENFYKVGFDNDVILESVNKLLALNNQESYSTLDVCLIDLKNEIVDFIKVGAPFGLVKREGSVEVVNGGALPIGTLDSINPSVYKSTITTKDIVILATDGITDAFATIENMEEFVSKLASNNPQVIAETILNEALRLNGMSAKDDMTVLVARTYLKSE